MTNKGTLRPIPSDQGIDSVILNTNVKVGSFVIHVQTEEIRHSKLIVTCVIHEGHVINRVERSYAAHESKPNLRNIIPKVANAQHKKEIGEVPSIWRQFNEEKGANTHKGASLRPVPVLVVSQLDPEKALELFELGLTLYKEEPLRAQEVWEEASRLDPDNKVYRANLKRLKDLSHGVLINDKNSRTFSACFKSPDQIKEFREPVHLRLVKD